LGTLWREYQASVIAGVAATPPAAADPGMTRLTHQGFSVRAPRFDRFPCVGRDLLYFDQLEIRRNAGVYSDLYVLRRSDGRVRQMTRESRLRDPDLSPDGGTLVCVKDGRGQRDLVLVGLPAFAITTLIAEPETQFDAPRWSPDG